MNALRASMASLAAFVGALGLSAACGAFEGTDDPGLTSVDGGGGGDSGDADVCRPIYSVIDERFDVGLGSLDEVIVRPTGATLGVVGGELVAFAPFQDRSEAQAGLRLELRDRPDFDHARLRFVLGGLVEPPRGYFVETGCSLTLEAPGEDAYSAVRVEVIGPAARLDDIARADGGTNVESGRGSYSVVLGTTPTSIPFDLRITASSTYDRIDTTGTVGGVAVRDDTFLAGKPLSLRLTCGIDFVNVSDDPAKVDAGAGYRVTIDDVRLEVCGR